MRAGWTAVLLLAPVGLVGSAWLCASGGTTARPGPSPIAVVTETPAVPGIEERFARIAEPLPALELPLGPIGVAALEPVAVAAEPKVVAPAEAERIARRYFRAFVHVEELASALPAADETNPRTPERFPGYFAAIAERDELSLQLSALPQPAPDEALPYLDLDAEGDDFERIYRNWSREDFLLEHWRLSRAVHAESERVLARRLADGPYDAKPTVTPSLGWG